MSALYAFSEHIFTNAGATGRTGPTLSAARTAYSTATWAQDTTNNWLNMTSDNGIQLWTVPKTGSYTINAAGAMGGGNVGAGLGACIQGKFSLTKGNVIRILVGQIGGQETYDVGGGIYSGGGGGGTFVVLENGAALIIVGGGGGRSRVAAHNASNNETDTFTGTAGNAGSNNEAYGGAGYTQNSGGTVSHPGGVIAYSYANGGVGGLGAPDGGQGYGGFGGGGGEGYADGGGGGGYSGGNSGTEGAPAGGGGSFFNTTLGSSRINNTGSSGHGFVTVTTLILTSPATLLSFTKNVYYQKYVVNSTFSIPSSSILTSNTDTSFSVTHSSGNTGIVTVTNSANTGTVTVKGLDTVQLTSIIAATANFTETTVALITVVIIGAGTTYANIALNSIDLSGTDLGGTIFSSCDLTSANLYGTTISNSTDLSTVTSMTSLRSGRIIGFTTLLPTGYKMI